MGSSQLGALLPLFLLVAAFLLLVVRPQRTRARELSEVRARLAPGVQVMTSSGLFGQVASVDDEVAVLEVAPGVRVRFAVGAVVRVVEPGALPHA